MATEILRMPLHVCDRAGQCPSTQARDAVALGFEHSSGSLSKSCGPLSETHHFFFLTFAILVDETMMDYFIAYALACQTSFSKHTIGILINCSDDERFYPPYIVTTPHQRASSICH